MALRQSSAANVTEQHSPTGQPAQDPTVGADLAPVDQAQAVN